MKKILFGKQYALMIIAVLIFSAAKAQTPNVEGPVRPGYFCRCTFVGYGCAGSRSCIARCSAACHRSVAKIGRIKTRYVADVEPTFIAVSTAMFTVPAGTGIQNRLPQLLWGTLTTPDLAFPGNSSPGLAYNGSQIAKLFQIE